MARYALIDTATNLVVNVVEINTGDGSTVPDGFTNFQSDSANIGDGWNGSEIVPKAPTQRSPR